MGAAGTRRRRYRGNIDSVGEKNEKVSVKEGGVAPIKKGAPMHLENERETQRLQEMREEHPFFFSLLRPMQPKIG